MANNPGANSAPDQANPNIIPDPSKIEQKLTNRYVVTFPDNFSLPSYVVNQITIPSLYVSGSTVSYGNLHIRLSDLATTPSTAYTVMTNLLALLPGKGSKEIDIAISILNANGEIIEAWVIAGTIIEIDFDVLDYFTVAPAYIHMTLSVRAAVLTLPE